MRAFFGFVPGHGSPYGGPSAPINSPSAPINAEGALARAASLWGKKTAKFSPGNLSVGDYYDTIAQDYDAEYVDAKSEAENFLLKHLLDVDEHVSGNVLDIGCGTGLLLDLFDIPTDRYCGVDPSNKMVTLAAKKHPDHLFVNSSAEYIPYVKDGTVDNVVSLFGPLNYSDDLDAILHETCRVLSPGGQFFHMFYATKREGKKYILGEEQNLGVDYYDKAALQSMFALPELQFKDVRVFGMTGMLEFFRSASKSWSALASAVGFLEIAMAGSMCADSFQYLVVTGTKGAQDAT